MFWMYLHKKYLLHVLNIKKYEIISYAKNILSLLIDIIETMKNFSKL
jgi:hypothetical protein